MYKIYFNDSIELNKVIQFFLINKYFFFFYLKNMATKNNNMSFNYVF